MQVSHRLSHGATNAVPRLTEGAGRWPFQTMRSTSGLRVWEHPDAQHCAEVIMVSHVSSRPPSEEAAAATLPAFADKSPLLPGFVFTRFPPDESFGIRASVPSAVVPPPLQAGAPNSWRCCAR